MTQTELTESMIKADEKRNQRQTIKNVVFLLMGLAAYLAYSSIS